MRDEFQSREVPAVQDQLKHLQQAREVIARNLRYTQIVQQKYYNKRHHFREFYKGDLVLLNTKNLQAIRSSKKLSHKYIKPFHIKESVKTQTYHLSLSTSYQIHSVFHISLLKSYESRGGETEAHIPENITINEHKEYEIEEILDRKNIKDEL